MPKTAKRISKIFNREIRGPLEMGPWAWANEPWPRSHRIRPMGPWAMKPRATKVLRTSGQAHAEICHVSKMFACVFENCISGLLEIGRKEKQKKKKHTKQQQMRRRRRRRRTRRRRTCRRTSITIPSSLSIPSAGAGANKLRANANRFGAVFRWLGAL